MYVGTYGLQAQYLVHMYGVRSTSVRVQHCRESRVQVTWLTITWASCESADVTKTLLLYVTYCMYGVRGSCMHTEYPPYVCFDCDFSRHHFNTSPSRLEASLLVLISAASSWLPDPAFANPVGVLLASSIALFCLIDGSAKTTPLRGTALLMMSRCFENMVVQRC